MGFTKGSESATIAELTALREQIDAYRSSGESRITVSPEKYRRINKIIRSNRTRKNKELVHHFRNNRREQAIQLYDSMNSVEKMMVSSIISNAVQSYRTDPERKPAV